MCCQLLLNKTQLLPHHHIYSNAGGIIKKSLKFKDLGYFHKINSFT